MSGGVVSKLSELPLPPGYTGGSAAAISGDGRRIVGNCWRMVDDFPEFDTCIWDGGSVSSLKERLTAAGVAEVDGWTLVAAVAISEDGKVICGPGINPDGDYLAWAAELP